jgi:myosin heavy subunit
MNGLQMLDSQCLQPNISNLIELHHLTENAVLHVLRNRYREDHIYTFVSSILIAVNPFRDLPIYGTEWIERYRSTADRRSLPPHIFITADNAYNSLIRNYISQSIVISGESGSGKTESIKLILKYVTQISRKDASNHRNIQDQILQANPVMEAFGNAKTSRNNNRSPLPPRSALPSLTPLLSPATLVPVLGN